MKLINYNGKQYTFDQEDSFILCVALALLIKLARREEKDLEAKSGKVLDSINILFNTYDSKNFKLAKRNLTIFLHPDRWNQNSDAAVVLCLTEAFDGKLDLKTIFTKASAALSNYRLDLDIDNQNDQQISKFFIALVTPPMVKQIPAVTPVETRNQSAMAALAVMSMAAVLVWSRVNNKKAVNKVDESEDKPSPATKRPKNR